MLADEEEAAAYRTHLARFEEEFQPVGERERTLVQNLADTQWRLHRIPSLGAGLFALGRLRYAELFEDEADPQVRRALLHAHILQTEAKHFKNLHLHESRLRRQYQQDARELKELQAKRKQEQEEQSKQEHPKEITPAKARAAASGFEFSNITDPDQKEKAIPESTSSGMVLIGADSIQCKAL